MLSSSEFIEESDLVKSGEHKGLRGIRFSKKNNKKAIPNERSMINISLMTIMSFCV